MDKLKLMFLISIVSISCSRKDNIDEHFSKCLSKNQVEVINLANNKFDDFVLSLSAETNHGNLDSAYKFYLEETYHSADLKGLFLPQRDLDQIFERVQITGFDTMMYEFDSTFSSMKYWSCYYQTIRVQKEPWNFYSYIEGTNRNLQTSVVIDFLNWTLENQQSFNSVDKQIVIFEYCMFQYWALQDEKLRTTMAINHRGSTLFLNSTNFRISYLNINRLNPYAS